MVSPLGQQVGRAEGVGQAVTVGAGQVTLLEDTHPWFTLKQALGRANEERLGILLGPGRRLSA